MAGGQESRERWTRGQDPPRGRARFALARRDLLEFVRDRRTLVVTLLLPMAMYPILALSSALGVRTAISDIDARNSPTNLAIMLTGDRRDAYALAQRVESLLSQAGDAAVPRRGWPASVSFAHGSPEEARRIVEVGDAVLWLEVPEGVLRRLEESETIALVAHGPETRPITDRERDQVTAVMLGLAEDARRRRIEGAGLPETLLEPLRLRFTGTADGPKALSGREILPTAAGGVFVLLAVLTLTGAFYPAIDAIAGEKERGTIETLLIAPCAPIDIVTGKFLAVWAVAVAALVANVISIGLTTAVSLRFLPAGGPLLPGVHLAVVAGASLLVFLGLSALAAAMCLAVTTASRSQKEAQNTLTPVLLCASALAGAGLLAELQGNPWLSLVPFGGQVAVARATLEPDVSPAVGEAHDGGGLQRIAVATALSLGSTVVLVWLMLHGTAWMLTDEEILFRGPDVAGSPFARPARRRRPTVAQGILALAIGLAGLWYVQGIMPDDLVWSIPVQQAAAVGLPLAILLAWQRVDLRRAFAIMWPGAGRDGLAIRAPAATVGAGLIGAGLFVLGVALLLAIRGTVLSNEAQNLSEKLLGVIRDKPAWLSWTLIALVPAVCEELLFRGWVQSALMGEWPRRGRAGAAILLQAACFAIFHLLPERMPQTFALGLVTGILVVATRSLLPAIVCHAAHNSMPLVLVWLGGGLAGATEAVVPPDATLPAW
ncbi:MAG: type II CAAX prenyl endopeptidase Rce1 family protein, partial [Planctomycetia bacterium]